MKSLPSSLLLSCALVSALAVSNPEPISAQWRSNRLSTGREKNGRETRGLFSEVVAPVRPSVVRFLDREGRELALGTIVDADGWVLTKASSVYGFERCLLDDGRRVTGEIVGISDDHDLALVHVAARELRAIEWEPTEPAIGQWLITPDGRSDVPAGLGVASVPARPVPARSAMLGIILDAHSAPTVSGVQANSGAERAGLLLGDVVRKIDGVEVESRRELIELISKYRVGRHVRVELIRGAGVVELEVVLGPRDPTPDDELLGGELSFVRSGFPLALQHDTPLDPRQCGGPLLDSLGRTRALNIARASRTASYAIPASEILRILPELRSGRMRPDGFATSGFATGARDRAPENSQSL